jgi:hypothetical protein
VMKVSGKVQLHFSWTRSVGSSARLEIIAQDTISVRERVSPGGHAGTDLRPQGRFGGDPGAVMGGRERKVAVAR